jgi:hypothetical protein
VKRTLRKPQRDFIRHSPFSILNYFKDLTQRLLASLGTTWGLIPKQFIRGRVTNEANILNPLALALAKPLP